MNADVLAAAMAVLGVSLAINGYFLKRALDRLTALDAEVGTHGERLAHLEGMVSQQGG